jgi:hypothetical protein
MAGVDTVITPNNLYVGAIGSSFGTQVGMQAYLTATVWNKLRAIYQYDAGSVLTAVRVLTFPIYFTWLLEAVKTTTGLTNPSASNAAFTEATVKLQWANKQSTAGGSTALDAIITAAAAGSSGATQATLNAIAGLAVGFDAAPFATVNPISDAQALLLLDSTPSASISLRSPVGIAKWLQFLSNPTSTSSSDVANQVALVTALSAVYSAGTATGPEAFAAVAGYLGAKASNTTSTAAAAYLSVVINGLVAANGMTALSGADLPASWSDVGALQFAQGWVVRALTSQTKSSMSALGLPGLTGTSEWFSYCNSTPALVAANVCPMTLVQAQAVLNLVSGAASNGACTPYALYLLKCAH